MSGGLYAALRGRRGALSLDVILHAPVGAVTALLGPSGAGKSTVLRALAGLERLDGEVRVNGEVWQDAARWIAPHRRAVGYVFQRSALLPHLSVRANLEYGRKRAGLEASALDEVVERLGIAPLLARAPENLSGGERQRVAVARALLVRPRLLLLDEPLSGLDAPAKRALLPRLREAVAGLAIPVVWVSHDPVEVAGAADHALRLEGGRSLPTSPAEADPLAGRDAAEVRRLAAAALAAGLG